jgi:uncharacterized protein YeaO (DUF488 family)
MELRTKRIYEKPLRSDGRRILIDRLWPRGVSKAAASIDAWKKDVAPSNELRRWYQHDPDKWTEFRRRYFTELDSNPDCVSELRASLGEGTATLVFSSKETALNNATALKEFLESNR